MKKIVLVVCFSLFSFAAYAQDAMKSILLSEDAIVSSKADEAEFDAKNILSKQPRELKKNKLPEFRQRKKVQKKADVDNLSEAPFGLSWGATYKDVSDLGVSLNKIELKDNVNAYRATKLPKKIGDFSTVDVIFGIDNSLWRIIAYSTPQEDTPDASKVLRIYKIYYDLLSQKYGNAKEFFTPYVQNVDVVDNVGRKSTKQEVLPLGNDNFLEQLKNGTAELYATFYNGEVGAALAVQVDGSGKSYLIIDYKNLRLLKKKESQVIDAL